MRAEATKIKGKYLVLVILFLLFIPSVHAGNWDFYLHDTQNTSSTADNGPEPPLRPLWNPEKLRIECDWLAPIVHGNVVYLVRSSQTTVFRVVAINITDGKILWVTDGKGIRTGAWSAFYYHGLIFIDTGWYSEPKCAVEAINATNGRVVWYRNGIFSANTNPYKNSIYFIERIENKSQIVSVDPFTGEEKHVVEIKGNLSNINEYIGISNGNLYAFNDMDSIVDGHSLYAINLTTGKIIWRYDIENSLIYLQNSPMIMGEHMLYVPFRINGTIGLAAGVVAINKTTGKLMWRRITDPVYPDFQYKFAYSPEYHMIVRANRSGDLIAINSKSGKVIWDVNYNSDKYKMTSWSEAVIAGNYIYQYGIVRKNPNDIQKLRHVGLLRIHNISNGKLVYQLETPYQGTYNEGTSSLDLPDFAVANGLVFIPDGYLYIFTHDNNTTNDNSTVMYASISSVVIGTIITAVFIIKKKRELRE